MSEIPTGRPSAVPRSLVLLAAAAVLTIAVGLFGGGLAQRIGGWVVGTPEGDETVQAKSLRPPGHWNRARPLPGSGHGRRSAEEREEREERARLVSLPYLGGGSAAREGAAVGVVRLDADAAAPGVNLYNSGHGPEAILTRLDGRVLHRWRLPFEHAFPDVRPTADTDYFRRVHLFPDGRLLALYQTGGLVFLDRRSRLLGRCRGNFYNDVWVGEGRRLWTIAKEVRSGRAEAARLDDFLVELRHEGSGAGCREVRRISLTEAFRRSSFAHTLEHRAATGDVLHTNTVAELTPAEAAHLAFSPGDLLVSLREIDTVAVIDPDARSVVWARRGPWVGQHEPSVLPDGRLLLFDNRGGEGGGSRIVKVNPASGEIVWSWSGEPPGTLRSEIGGACARLPGGNLLISESVPGHALEIDSEGRIVWELRTPHRAGPEQSLVAMLFEVQRLPREPFTDFLQ